MALCILDSADKTNLSLFISESDRRDAIVNDRCIPCMLERTKSVRKKSAASCRSLGYALCEDVGSLFECINRHCNYSENSYPLAHNLVTSHFVSGAVRFPMDLRQYRRHEGTTQWEAFVHRRILEREIPKNKKECTKFHKEVNPIPIEDPAFAALHVQFKAKIALGLELIQKAVQRQLSLFRMLYDDSWYLVPCIVQEIEGQHKNRIIILCFLGGK